MARGRRSTAQRENDLAIIAERYLRGYRQQDIADELDLTQPTVSNDLKTLYERWRESSLMDIDEAKARELARIDELERTYWLEWEASKKTKEVKTTKKTQGKPDQQGNPTTEKAEASVRKEERFGDPRYLAGVQWCIQRRCAILGIDAPSKNEHTGAGGGAIEHKHEHSIDAEQYTRALESLADALGGGVFGARSGGDGEVGSPER